MKTSINVTFNVSACNLESNNGEHTLELDLAGLTEDSYEQYALRSIVIGLQAAIRKATAEKPFNFDASYKVPEPGTRIATGGVQNKVAKLLAKLTPEQIRELLEAQLAAGE